MEMPITSIYSVYVESEVPDKREVHHFVSTSFNAVVEASSQLYPGKIVSVTIGPNVTVL